ncbi:MAG: NAD(P)-dependent oxidoreductase [Myxococcales bacterium]
MRVLVSGADGFSGTHLVRGLVAAGHEVIGAVFGRAPEGSEIRLDLRRREQLDALTLEVDAVVHAAGVVEPSAGARAMLEVNMAGTANLVQWARTHSVRHFVHVSSVAVYGPLLLGEDRDEQTPRLGVLGGLAYMRSKAWAEVRVEQSGVPYTLLRPPAIVGAGDTVISRGFVEALEGGSGIPMVSGARPERRVSVAFAAGLVEVVLRALARGPLWGAVHVVDAELSLGELAQVYAAALGRTCTFAPTSWPDVLRRRADPGFQWLAASARFGQHYSQTKLLRELGYRSAISLENAVAAGISGLQAHSRGLF